MAEHSITPYHQLDQLEVTGENRLDRATILSEENRMYYLKCEKCQWSTSYMDTSGYLNISTKKVQCPICREGKVEIISASYNSSETYQPPAYLDFVLADW